MPGLEDLYREIILDHYRSPRNRGELDSPPAVRVEGFNPLCGDEIVLRVEDHGPGVAAHERTDVFEPFHHARGAGGSGLGLAIARGFVSANGGRIWVERAPSGGASFAITLPVSDLRPVESEDLLGRDPVPPDAALLARNIAQKSVLVTGAGGSIGSELVRQIVRQGPRRLVLLEQSEAQLYEIDLEAENLVRRVIAQADRRPSIVSVLASVEDAAAVRRTIPFGTAT